MNQGNDVELLRKVYATIADSVINEKARIVTMADAKEKMRKASCMLSTIIERLDKDSFPYPNDNFLNQIKKTLMDCWKVKNSNPSLISTKQDEELSRIQEYLIWGETVNISYWKKRGKEGERIDIEEILNNRNIRDELMFLSINRVIQHCIKNRECHCQYYITQKGSRYHELGCPYCKGKKIISITSDMIQKLDIIPCRCTTSKILSRQVVDTLTIFIDETIKDYPDNSGSHFGNYSYIVCKGDIYAEDEIEKFTILMKGVELSEENGKTNRIASEAIGKVLMKVHLETNFSGNIKFFVDNLVAVDKWRTLPANANIEKCFTNVSVYWIPREKNRKADELTHNTICVSWSKKNYSEICDLNKKNEETEALLQESNSKILELQKELDQERLVSSRSMFTRLREAFMNINFSFVQETLRKVCILCASLIIYRM